MICPYLYIIYYNNPKRKLQISFFTKIGRSIYAISITILPLPEPFTHRSFFYNINTTGIQKNNPCSTEKKALGALTKVNKPKAAR